MTGLDVLNNASMLAAKKGLALGCAQDKSGAFCTAALLVEGAGAEKAENSKQRHDRESAYLEARRILCNSLKIPQTYQALVDWNDEYTTSKDGTRIFRRTPKEVIDRIRKAMREQESGHLA